MISKSEIYAPAVPQRLSAKFFIDASSSVDAADLVPVFHDWIGRQAVEEMLIDVADYSHVHQGPSLMLVALEADYVFDEAEGRLGLRYIRKRSMPDSLPAALALCIAQAAAASHLISTSQLLPAVTAFDAAYVEIEILDKLNYPDVSTVGAALEAALIAVGQEAFGREGLDVTIAVEDERRPLKLVLKSTQKASLPEIADRLRQSIYLQDVQEQVVA